MERVHDGRSPTPRQRPPQLLPTSPHSILPLWPTPTHRHKQGSAIPPPHVCLPLSSGRITFTLALLPLSKPPPHSLPLPRSARQTTAVVFDVATQCAASPLTTPTTPTLNPTHPPARPNPHWPPTESAAVVVAQRLRIAKRFQHRVGAQHLVLHTCSHGG